MESIELLKKNTALLQLLKENNNFSKSDTVLIDHYVKENLEEIHLISKQNIISEFKIVPLRHRRNLSDIDIEWHSKEAIRYGILKELVQSIEVESMAFTTNKIERYAEGLLYVAIKKD